MNFSKVFIHRPIATCLLTLAIILTGFISWQALPIATLPQVDYPTISVSAALPGASPETMAASVVTPLERTLGRIAGITEMTSSSVQDSARITLQFDLSREINGAARDVQAALNAARSLLPVLPNNPVYRKVNPANAPVMILALTSKQMTPAQIFDATSTILSQKLSQVDGVGEITLGGSALPAVRIELDPNALSHYGISTEIVRNAVLNANVNRPKGVVEIDALRWQIFTNDQTKNAQALAPLILATNNPAVIRLKDVAQIRDDVQDSRNAGFYHRKPAVLVIIRTQPGANVVATVDRIYQVLPELQASIPRAISLDVTLDRTPTIRASLYEAKKTLLIAIGLVVVVVFLFLGNMRAALIPSVAVPVSLIGALGVMALAGFSLNNLSLMALIIATGFVVDDAIVVLENTVRYIEQGLTPIAAALKGSKEVGTTVLSMSLSLMAVFIPLLFMSGIVGRLFSEFAITLCTAIAISLVVSLTTTPMMCAWLLKKSEPSLKNQPYAASFLYRFFQRAGQAYTCFFKRFVRFYEYSLRLVIRHHFLVLLIFLGILGFNLYLYGVVPKSLFPQQDTGRIMGSIQADQAISFAAIRTKLLEFIEIVEKDPVVDRVTGFVGGGQNNTGSMFITLKPKAQRLESSDEVIARLRKKLAKEPAARLFLQTAQDLRVGGRQSNAQYQYTLRADELGLLDSWEPKVRQALMQLKELADVNTDRQSDSVQTLLQVDRDRAAQLGVTMQAIDAALNNAFGQRVISTIYNPLNQYRIVLEFSPEYTQNPASLERVYVAAANGDLVPLSTLADYKMLPTTLAVNHQDGFAASTLSFNLQEGVALNEAIQAINRAVSALLLPAGIQGSFQGTAKTFQASLKNQVFLIVVALLTVYIVLGILYESAVHPVTILSTLPSAGVGALLALLLFKSELNIIALIALILLIGIVKKNAIMMIDFALQAQHTQGKTAKEAII